MPRFSIGWPLPIISKPTTTRSKSRCENRLRLGEDAAAHYRLGLLLLLSDGVRASQHLQSAAALDPEFEPATSTLLAAWRASSRESDPARAMLILGRALGLVEEWGLAAREFGRAVDANPQDSEAWAWLGESMQHIGQDGLPQLDRALAVGPRDSTVHILRGLYFRRQDKNSEAVGEYLRAAELEPEIRRFRVRSVKPMPQVVILLPPWLRIKTLRPSRRPRPPTGDCLRCSAQTIVCRSRKLACPPLRRPQIAPKDPAGARRAGLVVRAGRVLRPGREDPAASLRLAPGVRLVARAPGVLYLRLGENTKALDQLNAALQIDSTGPAAEYPRRLLAKYFPNSAIPPSPTACGPCVRP